ncbi:preprotein translocase subunit YajC [Alicyclobacillus acidoterrestris]|uniref:Preprotein translocase subunit YajC n=1 Tax=Alicyclobacillus acidoterrestris (strain ATCC 49025 / DSM 3922 / CIP 106132 / NCIMB 13137 / GD3B) TaxID=1356854 RepID=T0C9A5_ALIAG|nr:preprotein translocase subunit YajC [Alicyclobacillus acidoterrestris]EPZ52773.1 hypothetical protein N007_02275 [Alicyclobacillus acidoterrestris ATCC 49025]UNO48180.1 preprotein translocase subunit YajC [Alicyclobacillus acidoterrestris]
MHGNSLIFLVILVIVFYFLMILPQRRNQKKKAQMMRELAPGTKIMTASGIYAEVAEVHGDILVARVAEGVEIEMDTRAVVRVVSEAPAAEAEDAVEDEAVEEHPLGPPDEYVDEADEREGELSDDVDEDEEVEHGEEHRHADSDKRHS